MAELIHGLPKEVSDFIAECRKNAYITPAKYNYEDDNGIQGYRFTGELGEYCILFRINWCGLNR